MRFQIIFFSIVIILSFGFQNLVSQDISETKKKIKQKITGDYLGKKPPGLIPQKFDTGQLTGDSHSFNYSFSPDGNELFFSHYKGTKEKPEPEYEIKYMKRINNIWYGPETAFFSGKYSDCDITYSPDGKKLFFASAGRPHQDSSGFDIYYLIKTENGWTLPKYLGKEVNLKGSEVYASLSKKGNLFFRSDMPGGYGNNDLYKAEFKNGKFINVKNLGPQVNTKYMETDCFIAQDESYILFNTKRPEHKKPKIYVSFQIGKDKWTKGQSLGPLINSENGTMGSTITADGKYLFYISRVGKERAVYWVSTDIIKNLRKKVLKDMEND